jgi:hypothetical protein
MFSQAFEKDWEHRSVQLYLEQIKIYEASYRQWKEARRPVLVPLRKILGIKPAHKQATTISAKITGFWRYGVDGFVRARTAQIVRETTNWDDKKYWWFSAGAHQYKQYKIGDRILLFDFNASYASMIEVKDTTSTPVTTPDGRHFIAYRPVRGIPKKKLTKRFFDRLKFAGLISSRVDAHRGRKLSPTRWNTFVELFQGR